VLFEVNDNFFVSNFGRVLNFVCFLLGNSLGSEFYMPTFLNTLVCSIFMPTRLWRWNRVFRNVGI